MIFVLMYKSWKIFSLWILLWFAVLNASSQERFTFPQSADIGLNVTNVLTSFIGNSNADVHSETFSFVAKVNRKNKAIRFGVGFNLLNSDETLVDVEQVIFNNFKVNARVGLEQKKYLGNKFGFFYGLDLVSVLLNEESTFSNSIDIATISTNTLGVGGGPVYGFEYFVNKYFYIGTEGNFYGMYSIKNRKESFQFNPAINTERRTTGFQASITVPVHLYVMVRF